MIEMRYAIIKDNIVANVVVADEDYAAKQGWVVCEHAGPGWKYIDNVFIEPEYIEQQTIIKPSKEELLAQLQIIQQQILNLAE